MATECASMKPRLASFAAHGVHGSRCRTARVYCKAAPGYSLAVHDGMVVLKPQDPCDDYQRWVKDERFGDRVKDKWGFPSFALVNKATGLAIRHATAAKRLVQLVPYSGKYFDETVLWTEGRDGEFQAIRKVNDPSLNLDAFGANTAARNGTQIGLWEWNEGANQLWKITYYYRMPFVSLWGWNGGEEVPSGMLSMHKLPVVKRRSPIT